jgi:acetyl-CoA acyltransferase
MDVIELNEAFAAQGLAVLRDLGLADDAPREPERRRDRARPSAGRIRRAPGDGRVNQLHRTGGRYALCTMCIGVGQGIALIVERV